MPVQQSWRRLVGDVLVVSSTPCNAGAQPISSTIAVIYHCQHNWGSNFQQRPCGMSDSTVHLYSDLRSAATVASGQRVRDVTLRQAHAARTAQLAREGGGGVTVVGTTKASGRTAGDGRSDGYRSPNRSAKGGSGY